MRWPLLSITDIYRGKKSRLFHSHSPLVALLSNHRCFTIASNNVALHLEAVTEQIREEWVVRIVEILRVMGRKLEVTKDDDEEVNQQQQQQYEEQARTQREERVETRKSGSATPTFTPTIIITPATQPQQVHPSSTTLPPAHPSSSSLSSSTLSTYTPPSLRLHFQD